MTSFNKFAQAVLTRLSHRKKKKNARFPEGKKSKEKIRNWSCIQKQFVETAAILEKELESATFRRKLKLSKVKAKKFSFCLVLPYSYPSVAVRHHYRTSSSRIKVRNFNRLVIVCSRNFGGYCKSCKKNFCFGGGSSPCSINSLLIYNIFYCLWTIS